MAVASFTSVAWAMLMQHGPFNLLLKKVLLNLNSQLKLEPA
jgi:hypothetical protein